MSSRNIEGKLDELFEGMLTLKDKKEYYDFFEDLCTISELLALAQRFEVAKRLREGRVYSDIVKETGASTATISRVNRCLKYGNDGYKVQVTEGVYKGTGYSDWSTQLHYINVPLMLNAYLGTGFAVKAGVQIGFPLSGKMKYTEQQYTMTKDDVKYEKPEHVKYDLNSTLTKVTFAIPVGVSYEFSNVILDARYNFGLTQFQDIDGFESSKNRVFTFSVAYRLEL